MDEQKRKSTEWLDRIADTYDPRTATFEGFSTSLAEVLVREAQISEGAYVLDVGTGTGNVALAAARVVGPRGWVVGIDLSTGMLAQARRKVENLPVEFREMDAEALQFPDATFDAVVGGFFIAWLTDIVRGMREIYRVLRPGGRVALSTFSQETFQPLNEMTWARMEQYGFPRTPARPEAWMTLREPEHLVTLLEKGGFREGRVVRVASTTTLQSADEWWTFVRRSAARGIPLSQLSAESLERLRREILEDVDKLRTDDGIRVDTSALIGTGVR